MDPARWARIETLCEAAMACDTSERADFLRSACGDDRALFMEVQSLVRELECEPGYLEEPILLLSQLTEAPPEGGDSLPSPSIGPYRLIRRLGRGGMGEVFLAARPVADVEQVVALKVVRRGMDTDEVLQRFRLERRILANLHHPNIAQLVDAAATDDGRPYFVMEYVDGTPLLEYCDAKRLTIPARLALFQVICGAVQHAHQNLVVHRDLKPRNILVADGVPKLLDFGIGKVLAPGDTFGSAVETSAGMRLLTPEYAAPEQLTGSAVTTATDIYALGVLLFELLCGAHPYAGHAHTQQELEDAVLEGNPRRPSTAVGPRDVAADGTNPLSDVGEQRHTDPGQLRRTLAGDLDNICLMALRREPARRYPSAAAFAEDVQRYLDSRPVRARPDTLGYRAHKFVRRNAVQVAVAAAAFVTLGATTGVTLVQSRRVARESARVARERDKALEVRGFLLEMFGASGADQAVGDTVTARRLLDLQVKQLASAYADRPELRAEMMEVLADGYDRLGLYEEAEPLSKESLELRRRILGPGHPDVAAALNLYGWIVHERGRSKDAEPLLREAVLARRAAGTPAREDLARSLNDLGVVYNALSRYAAAESALVEALAIRRPALGDAHRAVGITANNLAAAYYFQGKLPDAVQVQDLAVRSLTQSVGPNHQRTIVALGNLAAFKRAAGDLPAAEEDYRALLARQTQLQGSHHPVTARVVGSLALTVMDRAVATGDARALMEADSLFRAALASLTMSLGPSHPQVGLALHRVAGVELERGQPRAALATGSRALELLTRAYGERNQSTLAALGRIAAIRWRLGERDAAMVLQRRAVDGLTSLLGGGHAETGAARVTLCEFLLTSAPAEAVGECSEGERVLRAAPAGYRQAHVLARLRLAQAHRLAGRSRVADSLLADVRGSSSAMHLTATARRLLDSLSK
jgi:serine/threonine-protein kinase